MSNKTAWLFAGQGSQRSGMGRDFYDTYPEVRPLFDRTVAGLDIHALCFDSDDTTLADTRNTQPAMAAFAAAVVNLLGEAGLKPAVVAGLSLGEYSALYAAGVFKADTLLELLAFRGQVMAKAAAGIKSRMTAVLGLNAATIEAAVAEVANSKQTVAEAGVVVCANYNCPGQIVIGGTEAAVLRAEELLKTSGAKRLLPLNTSGPFHTPVMLGASELLEQQLAKVELLPQRLPVLFNVTADTATDEQIRGLLVRQIFSPVLFEQSIRKLTEMGVDSIVEIGPGKVLSGFVRKTAPEITVHNIQTVQDFEAVVWEVV